MPTDSPRSEPSPTKLHSIAACPKGPGGTSSRAFFIWPVGGGSPRQEIHPRKKTEMRQSPQKEIPMLKRLTLALLVSLSLGTATVRAESLEMLNVSYDPTRELY